MSVENAAPDRIAITAEPIDDRRCRFVVDRPVYPGHWVCFTSPAEADASDLARRVFLAGNLTSVLVAHDKVTVTREAPAGRLPVVGMAVRTLRKLFGDRSADAASWRTLANSIGAAIRDHLRSGLPAVPDPCPVTVPGAQELRARIQGVLDAEINPVIAGHGGGVSLFDLRDNVVYLQMWGGCQGCGLADMTLKHGVEAVLRDALPELGEIFDLTDHRAGRNPYAPRAAR